MAKKRFRIKDKQGNIVDYDISAASVTLDVEGKSLEVKLTEIAAILLEQVKRVVFNGNPHIAESGVINLGNQMQPDWSESSTTYPSFIRNKPNFATVATSGSYNDLNDKPTIPDGVECDSTMSGTSEKPVQNKVIKAYVDNLINNLINGAPAALDTLKELADALGDNNDAIVALTTAIAAKISGIKVNGTLQTPDAQGNVNISVEGGDIPEKVSDLENDEGFVTAQDVAGIVAATGDLTIVESSDYIDILISHPELVVTQLAPMSASTKSGTFKVSGTHLKGDVTISTSATNWTLSADGGTTTSQSLTLSPTDGTLTETTITVIYSGSTDSTGNTITIASSGATSVEVTANYTVYAGPTILADDTAISFKAGGGSTNQQTLTVQGVNLEEGISAAISGTDVGKFSVSPASISQSGGSASGTLTITYSPAAADSGTHTANLTLSSSDATSKVITLNGAVSSLTVNKQSMTFSTDQGVAVTDTFTVEGANLNSGINIEASGTGFSVSPQTIAHSNGTVASTTITVTYQPSAAGTHTGSISIQSSGVTKTISLSGTAAAATTSDENGRFTKDINGKTIYFGRISDGNGGFTNDVAVYAKGYVTSSAATSTNRYSGDIVIPATVACDGTTYDVTTIEGYAFGSASLTSISLPEGLTTIKANAFRKSTLPSVTIPSTVTTIGQYAFYDMASLVTANMLCAENPDFQTTWDGVFGKSSALVELVIPDKVTGFVNNSFNTMTGLRKITFGTDLEVFNAVFNGNGAPGVTTVICRGTTTKPQLAASQTFDQNFIDNATIYVPDGYKQDYISNVYWVNQFNNAGRLKEMSELPTNE